MSREADDAESNPSSRGSRREEDGDEKTPILILSHRDASTTIADYDIVDEQGFVAGTEASETRKSRIEEIAEVDNLHKVFFYASLIVSISLSSVAVGLYASGNIEAHTCSIAVAGLCMSCAVIMSVFLIYCHLTTYTNPQQQRLICRILLMVPIYAIDSFVGLQAHHYGSLVSLVRDTYEAYVIYMFYSLLLNYLNGEEHVVRLWEEHLPDGMKHVFPLNFVFCFKPCQLNHKTLSLMKMCLVQYMIVNPVCTLIAVPLYITGYYKEGAFEAGNAYPYLACVQFVSVSFGFTALVYIYLSTKQFLQPYKPTQKFLAIKAVVFFCFWQAFLLSALNHFDLIPNSHLWTSDEVATGLQNFLVCIEMYIISMAHRYVFSDDPYMPLEGRRPLQLWQIQHVLSITDVIKDSAGAVKGVAKHYGGTRKPKSRNIDNTKEDSLIDDTVVNDQPQQYENEAIDIQCGGDANFVNHSSSAHSNM